jgi:hypothetical protein
MFFYNNQRGYIMKNIFVLVILAITSLSVQATDTQVKDLRQVDEYVLRDLNDFTKGCMQLASTTMLIKKNGVSIAVNCQTKDGGYLNMASADGDFTFTIFIHQTNQMNGSVIDSFIDSFDEFNIQSYLSMGETTAYKKCATKLNDAKKTSSYGNMTIKFDQSLVVDPICENTPVASTDPISRSINALSSLLSSH